MCDKILNIKKLILNFQSNKNKILINLTQTKTKFDKFSLSPKIIDFEFINIFVIR